jgi:hypothetical protein
MGLRYDLFQAQNTLLAAAGAKGALIKGFSAKSGTALKIYSGVFQHFLLFLAPTNSITNAS